ncbi:MAG TPA: hypothetical protein VKB38_14130 [Terracidiphilus sp.]|nr:hypothetical protein [Terracidiphilus sp.]
MIVRTQCKGHAVTALRVGRQNAHRYFAPSAASIELQIDDLRIECFLPPEFWRGHPEIRDERLCSWLEFKQHQDQSAHAPITLALTPSGENSYRLAKIH